MKTLFKLCLLFILVFVVACSKDNDCEYSCNEQTWYQDADDDGFGNASVTENSCTQPSGYVANNTDCDDSDFSINPGAPEIQDGKDNNCDGTIDECESDSDCPGVCVDGFCMPV